MAMTMPSKPFDENSMQPLVHVVHTPHPPPPPASNTLSNQCGRVPALRQETGVNGGGGMGSPVIKGRVLEGGPSAHDSRSLPHFGEGSFSHLNDPRGRESIDSERRKQKTSRTRLMANAPFARSSLGYQDEEKPRQFNPDPMPFQSSGFKPPLSKVRVEGTGVSLPNLSNRGPPNPPQHRSSTLLKKVPIPRRHQDMWAGSSSTPDPFLKTKGFILHSDRYQLQITADAFPRAPPHTPVLPELPPRPRPGSHLHHRPFTDHRQRLNSSSTRATFPLDNQAQTYYHANKQHTSFPELPSPLITKRLDSKSPITNFRYGKWNELQRPPADGSGPLSYNLNFNQRDRMALEQEYMSRMKIFKRRREVMQHREPVDLLLGGEKCSYTERMDITGEINKLKSVVLPKKAKDLYVGRGFKLPQSHALNHPRPRATFAPTLKVPSFARNLSRMPSTIRQNTRDNLGKTKPSNSNSIKPQTLEMDQLQMQMRTSRDLGNKKNETNNDESPREEGGGKWSKNEGNTEPGDAIIDISDINRPESEMDIKLADDQLQDDVFPTNHETNLNSSSPTKSASPNKTFTPNPLKATNIQVDDNKSEALRALFKRLDTDMDGHVMFNQLKSQVPEGLTHAQERFIKLVYDITSSSTFFGMEEFTSMTELLDIIANLSGAPYDVYQSVNFTSLEESISQYLELFTSVDRLETGKINIESLKGILATAIGKELDEDKFTDVQNSLMREKSGEGEAFVGKLQFLAHIPYFLSLELK